MNHGFCSKHNRILLPRSKINKALGKKALNKESLSKGIVCIGLFSVLAPGLASAAEWRLTPSLNLTETYTDNVTLNDGSDLESDWVSQINPALSLAGKGKKLELTFGYRMQNIFYASDSDRNNTNHQLSTNLKAALAPHWLFLDASGSLSQQVLSPDEKISIGNIGVVSGREDVLTASISPYITTRLSNRVLGNFRFTHDRVAYSGNTATDSSSDRITLSLQSAKAFGSWTWGLRYTEQNIKYYEQSVAQKRENQKRRDTMLDLGYQLSPRIRLTGQSGYEENEFQLAANAEPPQGRYWTLGAVWSPSTLTTLSVSGGERYFGRTWKLDWVHQARSSSWQLSYDENLTSQRQLQLEQRDFLVLDQNGVPLIDPNTLQQLVITAGVLTPTDEVFINRRANFRWIMGYRKSKVTFRANRSHRELQESGVDEITVGASLGWDWQTSRNSKLNVNVGSSKTERDTGDDILRRISLSYGKQLGKHVSSSYEVRNIHRVTNGASNNYNENQISASLRMSL